MRHSIGYIIFFFLPFQFTSLKAQKYLHLKGKAIDITYSILSSDSFKIKDLVILLDGLIIDKHKAKNLIDDCDHCKFKIKKQGTFHFLSIRTKYCYEQNGIIYKKAGKIDVKGEIKLERIFVEMDDKEFGQCKNGIIKMKNE